MKPNKNYFIVGVLIVIFLTPFFFIKKQTGNIYKNSASKLVVYSPQTRSLIIPIVSDFENLTGIHVQVVHAGTSELLEYIRENNNVLKCDVMWGGASTILLAKKKLFKKYFSKNEKFIKKNYKNKNGYVTKFSIIPSVIIINNNLIGNIKIKGYKDLLNSDLKGKIANADPEFSSSSFENLINRLYVFGNSNPDNGWSSEKELITLLDGKLLNGSKLVCEGVAEGKFTVGLTYEQPATNYIKKGAPISIIYPIEGTIMRSDGVAIAKNAKNLNNAKKFIDFLTGEQTQTFLLQNFYRRPVKNEFHPFESLINDSNIKIFKVDMDWAVMNREKTLKKYKMLFEQSLAYSKTDKYNNHQKKY